MVFIKALKDTLNPNGGQGMGETIIVLSIIISITLLTMYGKEVPPALMILVSAIGGIISGYKVGQNAKKESGEKDGNEL